ncbi:unnamed protein product [Miscanthus lutarioriparius]|uniref:Uncharacterized protein n=1 Tax=Miscanthus lutarioriparius TaxID=422564 RepID=A0A811RP40_9POAL|nr:unnamed protein product [Miscanthus lutarioriparius]
MDGAPTPKAGSGGKAGLPVPARIDAGAGDGAATPSAQVTRKATTLPGPAVGASHAPAAATAAPGGESNGGGSGGEEEDDEQVKRFYSLLDNIRAMRGAYGSGSGGGTGALDDGVDTGGGSGARVKRLRRSEPPWRPAFRLEDFEEPKKTPTSRRAPRGRVGRSRRQRRTARGAAERAQTSPR